MIYTQDPQDKIDYQVTVTDDTVSSATASISPAGPTLGAVTTASTTAKVRVSGMTLGARYTLTVHVIGASGQEWDRSVIIQCVQQ